MLAFVDESARRRAGDACLYALAAVLIDEAEVERSRTVLQALRIGTVPVLHWRQERPERRLAISAAIAGLPVVGVVAVHLHDYEERAERARRHCIEELFRELDNRGVTHVHMESRREPQDRKDRELLTALRHVGAVSRHLTVSWGQPEKEPMLWAANCVAGAVTWSFGDLPEYLELLGERVELLDVSR